MVQRTGAVAVAAERNTAAMGLAGGLAIGMAILLLSLSTARAEDQPIIKTHGISTFGDLKYPADFKHLDYVNPDAPKGGEISEAAYGTFDSLNPYSVKGNATGATTIMYESVLTGTADEIGASYCLMCETLEYPADRSWVIFNLRKDVTFSDGTPMTADDFLFSYNLFREKGIAEFRSVFNDKVQSAEVLDPYRIKFTFTPGTPFRDMPASVGGMPIFSKVDFEKNNRDLEAGSLQPFLGTGPYVLDSLKPGQQIILKRSPNYWGANHPTSVGQYNFDRIRMEFFGDDNAAFEGFKSGVYTFREETSAKQWATGYDFPALKSGAVIKTELPNGEMPPASGFIFNLRREKFQDPRVREAIGLMFNFEWSNQTLFYGLYSRVNSIWENSQMAAKGAAGADELPYLQPLVDQGLLPASILTDEAVLAPVSNADRALDRKNLRKASALLEDAGWTVGDDGMRRNAKGETLKVEFLAFQPQLERVISPYVENLRAAGVDASLSLIDPAQLQFRADPPNFDFDILPASMVNSQEPGGEMQQAYASITANNSTRNRIGLANPAVDKLIANLEPAKTRAELDSATRALDRVLRSMYLMVPRWYNADHFVAYFDQYDHPDTLPPYALGETSFWWYDAAKGDALRASGALK
jgi:microcin C transport system substrate-binding protein